MTASYLLLYHLGYHRAPLECRMETLSAQVGARALSSVRDVFGYVVFFLIVCKLLPIIRETFIYITLLHTSPINMCKGFRCGHGYPERSWIQFLILRILYEEPMHGYQLLEEIEKRSAGCHRLEPGSLYTILRRMEDRGLLKSKWERIETGPDRRVYKVTDDGAKVLEGGLAMVVRRRALMNDLVGFYKKHFEGKGGE
jgi:DNA-binding PadR family transcriptional regulator